MNVHVNCSFHGNLQEARPNLVHTKIHFHGAHDKLVTMISFVV